MRSVSIKEKSQGCIKLVFVRFELSKFVGHWVDGWSFPSLYVEELGYILNFSFVKYFKSSRKVLFVSAAIARQTFQTLRKFLIQVRKEGNRGEKRQLSQIWITEVTRQGKVCQRIPSGRGARLVVPGGTSRASPGMDHSWQVSVWGRGHRAPSPVENLCNSVRLGVTCNYGPVLFY